MSGVSDLVCRLADNAEAICRAYLPEGKKHGGYWNCGNAQGEAGQSLYVHLSGPRAGKWTDAATGEHGDLLDLIALHRGLDFDAAVKEAQDFLSMPAPCRKVKEEARSPAATLESARRLFAASIPITGTLAEAYLQNRALVLPLDVSALRFHPHCRYVADTRVETWPAMIAAVTDNAGNITGVHRTWLDPVGGKAPVEQPRRALGHLLGNGVRFGAVQDVLTAAEGIETALAIKTIMPSMPVIAALSAAHLAAFIPPSSLQRLYVAHDNDEAGRFSLARLRERFSASPLDLLALTPEGKDFNDDLLALGPERLRDRVADQLAPDEACRFLPPAA